MVDIYHREIDAPAKPRHVGYVLVGVGVVMILASVGFYLYTSWEVRQRESKPWEVPTLDRIPHGSPEDLAVKHSTVTALFYATLLLLASMFALILVATVTHRIRLRRWRDYEQRKRDEKRRRQRGQVEDIWAESGRRMPLPDESDPSLRERGGDDSEGASDDNAPA